MFNEFSIFHELADEADRIARHYYVRRQIKVDSKRDATPVTQADLEIEQMIRSQVVKLWPNIGILGEEFGDASIESGMRLIVDPIDGTRNFIRGIPFFATLLAVEVDGEVVAGMVSSAATGERWWARRRENPFCNYRSAQVPECAVCVSTIHQIEKSQAFHGSLFGCEANVTPASLVTLLSRTDRQRGVGDYYLHMLVASGAGEFGVDFGLKPWDKAALVAIVEGAGGRVSDVDGPFSLNSHSIVSSNGRFHNEILDILASGN